MSTLTTERPELPKGFGFHYNGSKPNIYLQLWHEGKKIFEGSTGTSSIKEAKQFRAKKEAELIEGHKAKLKRGVTVEDLFTDYVAHLKAKEAERGEYTTGERTNSNRVSGFIKNHLGPYFGNLKPGQVSEHLQSYKTQRTKEGDSSATINGEFRVLRAAMKRGWLNNKVPFEDL